MLGPKFEFTAQEIINVGQSTWDDIKSVKPWLAEEHLPELNDEQIVTFLLCCDNDQEMTKDIIKAHYYCKSATPELFNDRRINDPKMRNFFKVGETCLIPERTDDNCIVIVNRLYDTNYRNFQLVPYFKAQLMMIDAAIFEKPPRGLIFVSDMQGMGLMHLTTLRLGILKTMATFLQEGLPLNLKNLYCINCNYLTDKLMKILSPILKQDLLGKMQFFQNGFDMEVFYKNCVPRKCLPEDYGGLLPPLRVLHQKNITKLTNLEEHFNSEERQRIPSDLDLI